MALTGWKRILWGFGLVWLVFFLGGITALDLSTVKAAAVSAVLAVIPVIINYIMPFIKDYGVGSKP